MAGKLSVIIRCFNTESTLIDCITSVINQGAAVTEVICINDGSNDGTWNLLNEFTTSLGINKITVLNQDHLGVGATFNRGLKIASADWISFLDARDYLQPRKYETDFDVLNDQKFDALATSFQIINSRYEIVQQEFLSSAGDPWLEIMRLRLGTLSSNIFNRQALLDINGWDDHYADGAEYDLLLRLLKNGKTIQLAEHSLTLQRVRDQGVPPSVSTGKKTGIDVSQNAYQFLKDNDADALLEHHSRALSATKTKA